MYPRDDTAAEHDHSTRFASSTGARPSRRERQRRLARMHRNRIHALTFESLEDRVVLSTVKLGPLMFDGAFTKSGSTETATGTIKAGFAPTGGETFNPLLDVKGTLSFKTGGTTFDVNGELDALVKGAATKLWTGQRTFDVSALTSDTTFELPNAASITVASASFTLSHIELDVPANHDTSDARILLQGHLAIPTLADLSIDVSGANDVVIAPKSGISLTGVSATLNSPFSFAGIKFTPKSLSVAYVAMGDVFQVSGGLTAANPSGDITFGGSLGTPAQPGLVVKAGKVTSFDIGIDGNISAKGLTLSAAGLQLDYQATPSQFAITGGTVTVSAGSFSFAGTFGSSGLVLQGGKLTALDVAVSTSMTVAGLSLNVDKLEFKYQSSTDQFQIQQGTVTVGKSGDPLNFSATFGSKDVPGLVVKNGVLQGLDLSISSTMSVAGLALNIDKLEFVYQSSTDQFQIQKGTVRVGKSGDPLFFSATFGSNDVPGLVVKNGVLQGLDLIISTSISVSALTLTANDLELKYVAPDGTNPSEFAIESGTATVSTGSNISFSATFNKPGLVIRGGKLASVDMAVSGDVSLTGFKFTAQDLDFSYVAASDSFMMTGAVSLTVSSATITGTFNAPDGLVIQGGVLQSLDLDVDGNISVFGLTLAADDARVVYSRNDSTYMLSGKVTLTDVFSASVSLGTGDQPGIIIKDGTWIVQHFAMDLANIYLGAFVIQDASLTFDQSGGTTTVAGAATLAFPNGWALGASMTFVKGDLEEIGVSFAGNPGIEIPGTGLMITQLSAEVQNLDQPANILVSGSMSVVFGDSVSIGGTTASIFEATGSFVCDSNQLVVNASVYLGAYSEGGTTKSILGQGSGTLDLNWGTGVYSLDVSASLYDGIFTVSGDFQFDNAGDIALLATASVNVPNDVPFIGGDTLGSLSFAFVYNASTHSGFVAAWTTIDLFFFDVQVGFEYSYDQNSSGSFSLIGGDDISNLQTQASTLPTAQPTYAYTQTINVPKNNTDVDGLTVSTSWPANSGTQTIWVKRPGDRDFLSPDQYPSQVQLAASATTATSSGVVIGSPGGKGSTQPLTPGDYTIQVRSSYKFLPNQVVIQVQRDYPAPTIAIDQPQHAARTLTPVVHATVAPTLARNATVQYFLDTNGSGYNGKAVGTYPYAADSTGKLTNAPNIDLQNWGSAPLYLYAVISDGTNAPVYSAYTNAITPNPQLEGTVTNQFKTDVLGVRVFLDLNHNGVYDPGDPTDPTHPGEPTDTTDAGGNYAFNKLTAGTTYSVLVLPCEPTFKTPAAQAIPFKDGVEAHANFTITETPSIRGTVYSDLNQNGRLDPGEPGLGGVSVYIDKAQAGHFVTGDPVAVTGPSGKYYFYNLDVSPTPYVVRVNLSPGQTQAAGAIGSYSNTITSVLQQSLNNDFGVIKLVTLSGTVSGGKPGGLQGWTVNLSSPSPDAKAVSYPNFTSNNLGGLALQGAASADSAGALQLVGQTSDDFVAGAAWSRTPLPLGPASGFETTFHWQSMVDPSYSSSGWAFVIQGAGTNALGDTGTGFGYGGIGHSLAIVFNTSPNGGNTISIQVNGNTDPAQAVGLAAKAYFDLNIGDGAVHGARVTYVPGMLNVYVGDASAPILSVPVNLADLLGTSGTPAASGYVGFTAGTSGGTQSEAIVDWKLTPLAIRSTTTTAGGAYTFTNLLPGQNYSISEQLQPGWRLTSPFVPVTSFRPQVDSSENPLYNPAAGDFDRDGFADVAYATNPDQNGQPQIVITYGDGTGALPRTRTVSLGALPDYDGSSLSFYSSATVLSGYFANAARPEILFLEDAQNEADVPVHIAILYDPFADKVLAKFIINADCVSHETDQGNIKGAVAGDFNNDGFDDVVVATASGAYMIQSLETLPPASNGWPVEPSQVSQIYTAPSPPTGNFATRLQDLAMADVNGDGNLDVVYLVEQIGPPLLSAAGVNPPVYDDQNTAVTLSGIVAYGQGDGTFHTSTIALGQHTFPGGILADNYEFAYSLAAGTFVPGGRVGVVVAGPNPGTTPTVFTYTQESPGNFVAGPSFVLPEPPDYFQSVTDAAPTLLFTDVNGDGYSDLLATVAHYDQSTYTWNYTLNAFLTRDQPITQSDGAVHLEIPSVGDSMIAVDLKKDGYPDLVVPTGLSSVGGVSILDNDTMNLGTIVVTPQDGQVLSGLNFTNQQFSASYRPSAKLTGTIVDRSHAPVSGQEIFLDRNGNGKPDPGEPIAMTNSQGQYAFNELVVGTTYALALPGSPQSTPKTPVPLTYLGQPITQDFILLAAAGGNSLMATAAVASSGDDPIIVVPAGIINGIIFGDQDGDGGRAVEDSPLANVQLFLDVDHDGRYTPGGEDEVAVTDANGFFEFTGLIPGQSYQLMQGTANSKFQRINLPNGLVTAVSDEEAPPVFVDLAAKTNVLGPIANRTTDALTPVVLTPPMSVAIKGSGLIFALAPGAPQGAGIDPRTGQFSWVPTVAQAGRTYTIEIEVRQRSDPGDVEVHHFTITVRSVAANTLYVNALFGALLNRAPTAQEAATWTGRLQTSSRASVVQRLWMTPEHLGLLVDAQYATILGRAPDARSRAGWISALAGGSSLSSLKDTLLSSAEFFAKHPTPQSFLTALDNMVLGRGPTKAELSGLPASLSDVSARRGVINSVLGLSEDYTDQVRAFYARYLGQTPAPSTQASLVHGLVAGTGTVRALAVGLLSSNAFYNRAQTLPRPGSVTDALATAADATYVKRLVRRVLDRHADRAELNTSVGSLKGGALIPQVAAAIWDSAEHRAELVNDLFETLLHRQANEGEKASWTAKLAAGMTLDQVTLGMATSSEYQKLHPGGSNAVVEALSQDLLGHSLDSAGKAAITPVVARGGSLSQVVWAFLKSAGVEQAAARAEYRQLLHRDPTARELSAATKSLTQNDGDIRDVAIALLTSPDFLKVTSTRASRLALGPTAAFGTQAPPIK